MESRDQSGLESKVHVQWRTLFRTQDWRFSQMGVLNIGRAPTPSCIERTNRRWKRSENHDFDLGLRGSNINLNTA
jgi:hypothetical protein